MRIVFMGSPEVAVPFLTSLAKTEEIVGVITQKDRPAGRGYKLKPPAVKEAALKLGLSVYQPERIKNNSEFLKIYRDLSADLAVVIAFGKILPKEILDTPRMGSVNIHFSLLPKYRGPAPLQWALINGEEKSGVSIFWMNEQVDAGDIIVQSEADLSEDDTYPSALEKLSGIGIDALKKTLELIKSGSAPRIAQDEKLITVAPLLKKEDGQIHWEKSASDIHNLVRALVPWPGAYTNKKDSTLIKILETEVLTEDAGGRTGEIVSVIKNRGFVVKCGKNLLLIKKVQMQASKAMDSYAFVQGRNIEKGDILGS
ncbi:MAG: methionyl-tRNA formyltransferase [bacterium]